MFQKPDEINDKQQMNIKEILPESSRATIDKAADYIINHTGLVDEVLNLALGSEKKYAQRASRVMYFVAKSNPELIVAYHGKIISSLPKLSNNSVRGSLLRIFADVGLPDDEELIGSLADSCFVFMNMKYDKEIIGIYSMETLYRISNVYPDIKNELIINIEKLSPYKKPAFQARGRRLIKLLRRELGVNIDKEDDFY